MQKPDFTNLKNDTRSIAKASAWTAAALIFLYLVADVRNAIP